MVLFPVAALMLLGMAALAIDGGRLLLGREELQNAAEAAALYAVVETGLTYPANPDPASHDSDVQSWVRASVGHNFQVAETICDPKQSLVVQAEYRGETIHTNNVNGVQSTNVNGVYVYVSCSAQLTAAAIIPGVPGLSISAAAEAVLGSKGTQGDFLPYQSSQATPTPYPRLLPPPS